jgi:hypothetical protein
MYAAQFHVMPRPRDTPPGIAIGHAAKAPAHAVAQALLWKPAIRCVWILEDQFLQALSLARFSVRKPPQQKSAIVSAARRTGESHAGYWRVAQRFHDGMFRSRNDVDNAIPDLLAKTGPVGESQCESSR